MEKISFNINTELKILKQQKNKSLLIYNIKIRFIIN